MCDVGMIGLGVMGKNLSFNFAERGYSVAVVDKMFPALAADMAAEWTPGDGRAEVRATKTIEEFMGALALPRMIVILVKAGAPVDALLDDLAPHLARGDVVIDGGNEWYLNSEARVERMRGLGVHMLAMGISGGAEGARHGPCLMPGGSAEAFGAVRERLEAVAARAEDDGLGVEEDGGAGSDVCMEYVGPGGAGNYVKMVHNGIEYGDMELIAEAYALLRAPSVCGLNVRELRSVFSAWSRKGREGILSGFLVSITADVLGRSDPLAPDTPRALLDAVSDAAGSKGTGAMTVREAAERGVAAPTISAALDARYVSGSAQTRECVFSAMGSHSSGEEAEGAVYRTATEKDRIIQDVRDALYVAKVCSYAQGFDLIRTAFAEFKWELSNSTLARTAEIWRGGCIIRASLLRHIARAFRRCGDERPPLANLLCDAELAREVAARLPALRRVVVRGIGAGVGIGGFSASLSYLDGLRSRRLPTCLIQALRDRFGGHTFARTDREGVFHDDWTPDME